MAPRKTPVKRRSATEPRREELLRIAAETFAEKGFMSSTTREIADRAKTLSGSLYYHFESKEAMAVEVVTRYLNVLMGRYDEIARGNESPTVKVRQLVEVSIAVSQQHRDEVVILFQDWPKLMTIDPTLDERMHTVESLWVAVLEAGRESGDFREEVDPHLAYRTMMGAIAWVPRWYRESGSRSIAEIASAQADLMLAGLVQPRRRRKALAESA
jgi:TetR/AcrR family transcriptional regulator, cholesterol catabolism regulator